MLLDQELYSWITKPTRICCNLVIRPGEYRIPVIRTGEYTGVWLFVLDIKMLFSIKNKHFGIAKCY